MFCVSGFKHIPPKRKDKKEEKYICISRIELTAPIIHLGLRYSKSLWMVATANRLVGNQVVFGKQKGIYARTESQLRLKENELNSKRERRKLNNRSRRCAAGNHDFKLFSFHLLDLVKRHNRSK